MSRRISLFFQTITPEILSPADYIDWNNIKQKIKKIRREIALLNSLDIDAPLIDLTDLLHKHPNILKVLQLLIAHTPSKIYFESKGKYIDFVEDIKNIETNKARAREIAGLFLEMGLVEFLKEVKNVEDVIKGVLIGLEPNVRKNRRGKKLELILQNIILTAVHDIEQKEGIKLLVKPQMYINLLNDKKKLDYVILLKDKPKVAIEVNFYSTSGSKPSEVLGRAYPELQDALLKRNIALIVITDGIGWEKMRNVLETAYKKLYFLMNIRQAKAGMLKKSIIKILKDCSVV